MGVKCSQRLSTPAYDSRRDNGCRPYDRREYGHARAYNRIEQFLVVRARRFRVAVNLLMQRVDTVQKIFVGCSVHIAYPNLNRAKNSTGPVAAYSSTAPPMASAIAQGPTTDSHGAAADANLRVNGNISPMTSTHGSA